MINIGWILSRLSSSDILDIFLVTLVLYALLRLIHGTQAVQLVQGGLVFMLLTIAIASIFQLTAFTWLVRGSISALMVAIPVIFQPEIRRALSRLGRTGMILTQPSEEEVAEIIEEVCDAVEYLSQHRLGGLIVFERETGLQEFIDTGIPLDSQVGSDILIAIFYPYTALHDGAVIIRGDRLMAAGCVLPLSERHSLDRRLGTRHRAAIGLSEQTDAIVVVVSEERGTISVAHDGRILQRLDRARLRNILCAMHRPSLRRRLRRQRPWHRLRSVPRLLSRLIPGR
ncbi:MAG: diadenylate cyclase CdaA [Chloroflexota bacterium]|nr:diadenylate cyclase CdaA [Chloroflexota bacterium]